MDYFRVKKGRGCDLLFDDLRWVLKARSTDETRYQLQHLRVDETLLGCTDGHRMHIAYNQFGLPSGTYEPVFKCRHEIIFLQVNHCGSYPDIFSPIIWKHAEQGIALPDYYTHGFRQGTFETSNLFYQIAVKTGACVNFDYLRDAYSPGRMHTFSYSKEKLQLFIRAGDLERIAVVMGMRV